MAKYVFFTGGVSSSIGKGVTAAALGAAFEARGLRTTITKLDPYINLDPGTMNPQQHGEVFVTHDGAETDLDLGHYERFLNRRMGRKNNCTAGQIYERVIRRERRGGYLGATVQVIPHITDEIKKFIVSSAQGADVAIIETGGTVGDIESLPFLEAIRQMRLELGADATCYVHLTLVPYVDSAGELKTKPTQHSVRELREIGIQPDFLLCRSVIELPDEHRNKIGLFANLPAKRVYSVPDVDQIYRLPILLSDATLDTDVCNQLNLSCQTADFTRWQEFAAKATSKRREVIIGLVGKYPNPNQSYKSLMEALEHAGVHTGCLVKVRHLDLGKLSAGDWSEFEKCNAILVPGAFGTRGIDGKLAAIGRAREHAVPYLGICIGMQLAIIEYARNHAALDGANSAEFDSATAHPIINLERGQKSVEYGGSMRLGASKCELKPSSLLSSIYAKPLIEERHRHRYEFNNAYREQLEKAGLVFSAWSPDKQYCEAIEIADHPWFVATQFHPEYESTPLNSHPLFKSFITAAGGLRG